MGRHTRACAKRWSECNEKLPVKAQRVLEFPPSDLWPPPQDDVVRRASEEIAHALHKKLSLVKCYAASGRSPTRKLG